MSTPAFAVSGSVVYVFRRFGAGGVTFGESSAVQCSCALPPDTFSLTDVNNASCDAR